MAIAIAASSGFYQTTDHSSSFDASGGNFLLAGLLLPSARTISSITYGGVALTQRLSTALTFSVDGALDVNAYWYTLTGPATGSNTFAVNANVAGDSMFCVLFSLTGVNTANPIDDTDSGEGDADTDPNPSYSLTASVASTWGVMVGTARPNGVGANYHNPGTGFTEHSDAQGVAGDNSAGRYVVYKAFTGTGAKTFDGTNNYDVAPRPDARCEIVILLKESQTAGGAGQFISFD